jgi:hypothetical protein
MVEKPELGKATVNKRGNTLEIIIPSKRNWFVIIFLCVWMRGWIMNESIAPN